jgi:hypothetical protein
MRLASRGKDSGMTRRLLLLNGLAVLGVIFHHASGYGFRALFFWTDRYLPVVVPNFDLAGSPSFYGTVWIQQLDAFTLPAFMLVSGFFAAFAAAARKNNATFRVIASRLKFLLVPYVLWTLLFFVVLQRRAPHSLEELVDKNYYILLLSQYYLIAPLILRSAKKVWIPLAAALLVFEITEHLVQVVSAFDVQTPALVIFNSVTPKWLMPNLGFWFVLGIVIFHYREQISIQLARLKWQLILGTALFGLLTIVEYRLVADLTGKAWLGPYYGGVSRLLYTFFFIASFLALSDVMIPFSQRLSVLGSKSLGVYLAHSPVMYVTAVILYRNLPGVLGVQLLYQGALVVAGLAVPLLIMYLSERSPVRRYYRYIFG